MNRIIRIIRTILLALAPIREERLALIAEALLELFWFPLEYMRSVIQPMSKPIEKVEIMSR